MRTFGLFSMAAAAAATALAFLPFASAAPLETGLVARAQPDSIVKICADVEAALTVQTDKLKLLTKDTATVEIITPILGACVDVFVGAKAKIDLLRGQSNNVIYADVNVGVVLAITDVAAIFARIFINFCLALQFVISVCDLTVFLGICVKVGLSDCLLAFIGAFLDVCVGILVYISPLIVSVCAPILLKLQLVAVAKLLAIV